MPINKSKNKKAFTLIELTVSISIMLILSVLFISDYKNGKTASGLYLSAQKLASNIRLMQTYALGLKKVDNSNQSYVWGLYLVKTDKTSYKLFKHNASNIPYQYGGTADLYKTVQLEQGIEISDIKSGGTSINYANVTFEPPEPNIIICNSNSNCNQVINQKDDLQIILKNNNEKTISVELNKYGLVEIK